MKYYLGWFIIGITLIGCEQKAQKQTEKKQAAPQVAAPVTVKAGAPVVVQTASRPPAKVVTVPEKPGSTFQKGTGKFALVPPKKQKAGFQVHMQNYDTEQGLALSSVTCSLLDKAGNMWFGTLGGGVSRFDGTSFTTYTIANGLAGNGIYSLFQDRDGNLWFGTAGSGVSRYDGIKFTSYTTAQGLAGNTINCITQDSSGNLWFGTLGDGASRYDGTTFTTFTTAQGLAGNTVNSILQDRAGILWFGTERGGVSRYDGTKFTTYATAQGLADNQIYTIFQDKAGYLWFGYMGGGVSRYDGTTFTNYSTAQGLAGSAVYSILQDKSGNLWFGTLGKGVSRYDGTSFTNYSTAQGLAGNSVYSITQDRTGNLWFGTFGGGVSRFEGTSFTTYTTVQGLASNSIYSSIQDRDGNLWFGTLGGGVSRFDGTSFATYSIEQGLPGSFVNSILQDKAGNFWFAAYPLGLSRYNGTSYTTYTTEQGLPSNGVYNLFEDNAGNLWVGTFGEGVSRFDGTSFTNYTTAQGLADNSILCVNQDKNNHLWIGTAGGGVSRFDGTSFTNYTTAQGLAGNNVLSITRDQSGILWIGTEGGGVSRYDGTSFLNFTTVNGLPDNVVNDVVEREQTLFFGTNQGIAGLCFGSRSHKDAAVLPAVNKLSNKELMQHFKPQWEVFNTATGYPIKDLNFNSMLCDNKGIIWAGTGGDKTGLVRFDYAAVRHNAALPKLMLKNLKLNEENICWYNFIATDSATLAQQQATIYGRPLAAAELDSLKGDYAGIRFDGITRYNSLPQNLVLPYRHNNITLEFGALELTRPQLVNYQYMLEGYDKNWSPVLKKTSATFGNISEGSYTFKLRAQSPAGVWTKPLTYSFQVLPPWYRTWWAYLSYAALAAGVLGLLVRLRERKLKRENELLDEKVQVRTRQLHQRTQELTEERDRSDSLLLNILPAETAEELKQFGKAKARNYDQATVLFADMKGFTLVAEALPAEQLVSLLDEYFQCFDHITERHGLEKIKTIGDAYLCAGGLRREDVTTPQDVVRAALDIQQAVRQLIQEREQKGLPWFELRIGIHTGPVVAGVVGIKKFAYDIWGDTVNTAARMEQTSEPGRINISGTTFELVKEYFACTFRGKIQAKNKGEMEMYFVERERMETVLLLAEAEAKS